MFNKQLAGKIGQRIREQRLLEGLRQEDLGKMLNVGKSAVSQWESGLRLPDTVTLYRLGEVLGVSLDYLTGRTDNVKDTCASPFDTSATSPQNDDPLSKLPAEAKQCLEEFKQFILKKYGRS